MASAVNINLVPPAEVRPKLQRLMLIAVGLGVILGMFFGLIAPWWVGLIVAVVIAGPLLLIALAGLRRDQSIDGTVITSRSGTTRVVDLATAGSVTFSVHRSRVDQVLLRADGVAVTLAVYAGERGRELPVDAFAALERGLRDADVLARHEAIDSGAGDAGTGGASDAQGTEGPAARPDAEASRTELADLLRAQLRAEAVGAALPERALHKATRLADGGVLTSGQAREAAAQD